MTEASDLASHHDSDSDAESDITGIYKSHRLLKRLRESPNLAASRKQASRHLARDIFFPNLLHVFVLTIHLSF